MNVLFLTQTGALGPSSRYRVYQLLPLLREHGIEGAVSPAMGDALYRELYLAAGRAAARRAAFGAVWRQRRSDLCRVGEFDAVVVQKGVFPGLYSGFERRIAARKPLVFDFDDAIWLPRQGGAPLLRLLHRERAVQDVLRCAAAVIAGNEVLAEYAGRFNRRVCVVPSAVDTDRYPRSAGNATVGWIGSRTTLAYLKPLAEVFRKLNVRPRVIASGDPAGLGFETEFRPWRLETEVDELSQIGIGLAPLPDSPWERGKCGVKLLQYMACGIPVVASPVGVHNQIVRHGETGFLARSAGEWETFLAELIAHPGMREKFGAAGRELARQTYDVRQAADRVASLLKTL